MRRVIFALVILISACTEPAGSGEQIPGRWYTQAQVEAGQLLFQASCAGCHGLQAQGIAQWRERDAAGNLPPPPLNGSAHAWHHSRAQLRDYILDGGVALGGSMPGFRGRLSNPEVLSAIAYFQNQWPEETYARWAQMHPPAEAD